MCICSCSITIFYMRCLNVDRPLCFRTENIYGCFFASSSIDVEFSWVECEYECVCMCMCIWAMKFSLGFFSLSANKHFQWLYFVRARTRTWNDKMRIQSVAKIRLSLPKPIRMKSAKFVFVHKCVELYILYLSMRLAITPSCSLPPSHSHNVRSKEEKNTNICHFISASSSWMASFVLCNTFNLLCCWPIFMAWHSLSHQIYKVKHKLNMLSVWQGFQQ